MRRNPRLSLLVLLLVMTAAAAAPVARMAAQEAAHQEHQEGAEAEHDAGWWPTIQRTINFGVLAGLLYWVATKKFGVPQYLQDRGEAIRKDLVDAKTLRTTSEQQLAEVRERLTRLPGEIDALRRRGQEELAQERARLADAATRERDRVLERTRREIDMQFRVARRDLLEHAAELSMSLARTRIERDITPDDQARLIERYASEVRP